MPSTSFDEAVRTPDEYLGNSNTPDAPDNFIANREDSGIDIRYAEVGGKLYWGRVALQETTHQQRAAKVNIAHCSVGVFSAELFKQDDLHCHSETKKGCVDWPRAGNLRIHGFTYGQIDQLHEAEAIERPDSLYARLKQWLLSSQDPSGAGFAAQPFTQLAQTLVEAGHDRLATNVYIQRELTRRRRDRRTQRWGSFVGSALTGPLLGFGYKPLRPIWWLFLLPLSLGCLAFWWVQDADPRVFVPRNEAVETHHSQFSALAMALDVFVPLAELDQRNRWRPLSTSQYEDITATPMCSDSDRSPVHWAWVSAVNVAYTYGAALGWLGGVLLVVGLTPLVRRP